jgi:hypothetical protein
LSTLSSGIDEEVLAILGKHSGLDSGEHPYLDHVGQDSFYGFLASHRRELFQAVLQEARAFQNSSSFAPYRKLRQAAEHRLARLMQLGARQARYVGRTKTLFQLLMAVKIGSSFSG